MRAPWHKKLHIRIASAPLLVKSLCLIGLLALVPAMHASFHGHPKIAQSFFYSAILIDIFGIMLAIATFRPSREESLHIQLASFVGSYVILPFAMMVPLVFILPNAGLIDLWFEMTSSMTTTGASLFPSEELPQSVHLWRALIGWYGGFLVLVAAWAILLPLNLGGGEVLSGIAPGHLATTKGTKIGAGQLRSMAEVGRHHQVNHSRQNAAPDAALSSPYRRLRLGVMAIFPVYAAFTLILWLLLVISGMTSDGALIYAMGAMSSSGITDAAPNVGQTGGFIGELILLVFITTAISRRLLPFDLPGHIGSLFDKNQHGTSGLWQDPEIRLALIIIFATTSLLLLRHIFSDAGDNQIATLAKAFWGTLFTVTSFLTTTGYLSQYWPDAQTWAGLREPGLLLMGLAIIGGGVATTAGGVTLLRIWALLIQSRRELEKVIHPNSVTSGAVKRQLAQKGAWFAWVFFMLYALSVFFVLAILTGLGVNFTQSLVLTIAALSTTGPLAQIALQEPILYASLTPAVKIVLGLVMILGRLETLALIALFVPSHWRR